MEKRADDRLDLAYTCSYVSLYFEKNILRSSAEFLGIDEKSVLHYKGGMKPAIYALISGLLLTIIGGVKLFSG